MANPTTKVALQFSLHSRSFLEAMLLTLAESFDFHLEYEKDLSHQAILLRYEDLCRDPSAGLNGSRAGLGWPICSSLPSSSLPSLENSTSTL